MPMDRVYIGPVGGLQTNLRPFMIPDEAFAQINNAYVFRGRVRKRFGSYLLNGSVDPLVAALYSRLRVQVGTTDGSGDLSGTVPGAIFGVGQQFSIGDEIFTVNALGTPAVMLTTGASTVHTYNTTTGDFVFNGAAASTDVYFYTGEPVMGIVSYETSSTNDEPTYAFDTQFAYQYTATSGGEWSRLGSAVWTGNDSQFFWGANYRGSQNYNYYLYVTNFNDADDMQYWDSAAWNTFTPVINGGGDFIQTARLIMPFKDRLLLLNTVENISASNRSFANRCRFSWNGSPVDAAAWREDIPGSGGYIDAPTKESIITAEFLQDRLVVFFERSTWSLVYTGNQILPFVWEKLNTELGAESTFSVIPFDKVLLGVGNVGIHACNGYNVERIDQKIPQTVFEIDNDHEGVLRVNGIRDYFVEMVYWTFPASINSFSTTYPNRVLTFNYATGTWAFNDDTITCFGYFQNLSGTTWESTNATWEESVETWQEAVLQSKFRQILAGNQQGFTFVVDTDTARNAPALSIYDMTPLGGYTTVYVVNHNLADDDYVLFESIQGSGTLTSLNGTIQQVKVVDSDTLQILVANITGVYRGGGTLARVSNIDIFTKQYNFYAEKGRDIYVSRVEFLVDATDSGSITVDSYPSATEVSLIQNGVVTGTITGTGVLDTFPYPLIPLESEQDRLWHPVYFQAEGECVQLRLYFSPDQMTDVNISQSDFELHAMLFYCMPTTARLQ